MNLQPVDIKYTVICRVCIALFKRSIKDFFSKCDQIQWKERIWSHSLKKSLIEVYFFCAVILEGVKVKVRYVVERWHKWQNYSDKQLPYMKFIKTLMSEDLFSKKYLLEFYYHYHHLEDSAGHLTVVR